MVVNVPKRSFRFSTQEYKQNIKNCINSKKVIYKTLKFESNDPSSSQNKIDIHTFGYPFIPSNTKNSSLTPNYSISQLKDLISTLEKRQKSQLQEDSQILEQINQFKEIINDSNNIDLD